MQLRKSILLGHGLLGIDTRIIKDMGGTKSERIGKIPARYAFFLWNNENGEENIADISMEGLLTPVIDKTG